MNRHVRVGVGVLIWRGESLLVGKRLGAHGRGEFALPGGHLEFGESWEECAQREVLEETGLHIRNVRFETAVNSIFGQCAHYVTVFMHGDAEEDAEPRVMEPNKCEAWIWAHHARIPQPVFLPLQLLMDSGHLATSAQGLT